MMEVVGFLAGQYIRFTVRFVVVCGVSGGRNMKYSIQYDRNRGSGPP